MNVVWHDHEGMQNIMPERVGVVLDGFYDQVGNGWLAEVERPRAGLIQQTVQCGESLSGAERTGRERSMWRQTSIESPSEKNRLFRGVDVRKPTPVKHPTRIVPSRCGISKQRKPTWGSAADQGVRPTKAAHFYVAHPAVVYRGTFALFVAEEL